MSWRQPDPGEPPGADPLPAARRSAEQQAPECVERPAPTAAAWSGERAALASLPLQLAWLLLLLAFVSALHASNDGLWFQGDSPRHAANGLFWWDLLWRMPSDVVGYTLAYYARYPVIHPTAYPPAFYVLEGAAFAAFGPSPFVAKGLVLATALLAGVYLTAWLRRWVAREAGWAGGLLLLQPGMVVWSNAVMLNVPAMAFGLGALYHAKRWLEEPEGRHLYPAGLLGVLATLTYVPFGIVGPIAFAWLAAERRWFVLRRGRVWLVLLLASLAVAPWMFVVVRSAPVHLAAALGSGHGTRWALWRWVYYFQQLPKLFDDWILGLAALGALWGLADARVRRETRLLLLGAFVFYVAFSWLSLRDERYALLLAPLVMVLAAIGLLCLARFAAARLLPAQAGALLALGVFALAGRDLWLAPRVTVPSISGVRELVAFLESVAPTGRFFYDGRFDGVVSFYLRAGDPGFRRGLVLGDKLLYSNTMGWQFTELVSSPGEVVDALARKCGCQWLAVERVGENRVAAARYLREVVRGPEFQLVRSFPVTGLGNTHVDVYKALFPVQTPEELELRFPTARPGDVLRIRPLER